MLTGIGTWDPSVNNDPRLFSKRLVCFYGDEGTMGGAAILGS